MTGISGKTTAIIATLALVGSLVLHYDFGLSLGASFLVFFLGWPLVELAVTFDEGSKGGWAMPDGTIRPPWRRARFWARIAFGVLLGVAGFAIDAGKAA
ncbi:MAG TPA: hypothetical protein VHA15_02710 [Burkholderiales bacterium]|nr:hypothetical protein [Burkholderiales bacterium]